jgi:hypothetical protein
VVASMLSTLVCMQIACFLKWDAIFKIHQFSKDASRAVSYEHMNEWVDGNVTVGD